jgi:hypothetical protein
MSTVRIVTAAVLAFAAPLVTTSGVLAGGSPKILPVSSVIADSQNGFLLRIGSDDLGAYVNTRTVESVLEPQNSGTDWLMSTYGSVFKGGSNRTVLVDLTEPVSFSSPPAPFAVAAVQAFLAAKCGSVQGIDMLKIPVGSTAHCGGAFHFLAPNGKWYKLSARPDNYPDVTDMNVTCRAADSTGCSTWSIGPDSAVTTGGDPNVKGVLRLLQYDQATDTVLADLGDYYISFAYTISR